jgi:hypothetical protein
MKQSANALKQTGRPHNTENNLSKQPVDIVPSLKQVNTTQTIEATEPGFSIRTSTE